ncbi:MAG: hypothetical protein A3K60_05520 [Euryarchaeota archaeon RBG_19FT_COMBO_56_21]|nr:MAG: hypothetical protein A3K60_05520 [Euryarchaeota archaeon RBG_19FT_COMBO_56_21]
MYVPALCQFVVDIAFLADDPVPSLTLVVGGLLSIAIAMYGHREDSYWDEVGTFFAFLLGAAMFVIAFAAWSEDAVNWLTLLIIVILALTLFLKPMREIPWAAIMGALAGGAVAAIASFFLPSEVFGIEEWIVLLVIFLVVGTITHFFFHFIEDLLLVARMVLDWKPTMVIVGLVAIAEGILILMDMSILSYF